MFLQKLQKGGEKNEEKNATTWFWYGFRNLA